MIEPVHHDSPRKESFMIPFEVNHALTNIIKRKIVTEVLPDAAICSGYLTSTVRLMKQLVRMNLPLYADAIKALQDYASILEGVTHEQKEPLDKLPARSIPESHINTKPRPKGNKKSSRGT